MIFVVKINNPQIKKLTNSKTHVYLGPCQTSMVDLFCKNE